MIIFSSHSMEFKALADITEPSLKEYSLRHNHSFYGRTTNANHSVQRISFLLRLMETSDTDFIWFVGCDVMVTNHETRIEDFVDDKNNLFICKDVHGLNCDSFILRNCRWSRSWLQLVILLCAQTKDEQEAMILLENVDTFKAKTKYLPHPSINSYLYDEYDDITEKISHQQGNWLPGDFVLHLPGLSLEKRIELFSSERIKNSIIQ